MAMTMAEFCRAQGEATGEVRGLRRALETVLTERFGGVPPEVRRALERANTETLEVWYRMALTAATLEEVGIAAN